MSSELKNYEASLPTKTSAQIGEELAAIELEMKELDLEIKREQVAAIKAKRQTLLDAAAAKRIATLQFIATREVVRKNCNHAKGGQGAQAVIQGRGTSPMKAVIHHMLPLGKPMVLCQRCGMEWHPANPFNVDNGRIVPLPATPGYEEALSWPTDNTASGSAVFFFAQTPVPLQVDR